MSITNFFHYPEELKCEAPTVKDGEVSPSTAISPGSSYSVTCKDGYTLKGTATVTCTQSGGEATLATLPTCEEGNAQISTTLFKTSR